MLCRNRINSSAHLFFFVIIQINFCQSIDVFFEFFIIVKHRLLPPINNKKLPEGNFLPMKIYSELFLCLSIFSRSCKSLNAQADLLFFFVEVYDLCFNFLTNL